MQFFAILCHGNGTKKKRMPLHSLFLLWSHCSARHNQSKKCIDLYFFIPYRPTGLLNPFIPPEEEGDGAGAGVTSNGCSYIE